MKPRSCGVLLEYKKKFLLVKSFGSTVWGIPKGVQEGTESEEEAAIRETIEESGIAVSDLEPFMEYSTKRKNFTVFKVTADEEIFTFVPICTSLMENGHPEIDAFAWVDKQSAMVLTAGTHAQQIFKEL